MQFLYYIRKNGSGLQIELGPYDPDRFEGKGGHRFAFDGEVWVSDDYFKPSPDRIREPGESYTVQVMQKGNSLVSLEDAKLRALVNETVLGLGTFIQEMLDKGESLDNIYEWLMENIGEEPVEEYKGGYASVEGRYV